MISGAQAMIECLRAEGITVVFGYPGAAIAPFFDCLPGSGIRNILPRSEQGAGHAANGYARVSGRPGVCLATSGPGGTNLFTAIATAYSDSIPMVAITGQVATSQLGRDAFQEVDTVGACASFSKHTYLVKSPEKIGRVFKEAFHIASTGRKGPVVIDIPVDVQQQMVDFHYPEHVSIRGYKPDCEIDPRQMEKVVRAFEQAERPLVCFGGGMMQLDDPEAVKELCESITIPLASTMMGISALPFDHPLYLGMIGQAGHKTANTALNECDLLVLVGARVGDRSVPKPALLESSAAIVHIDIDAAEIGKNVSAAIPLVGEASRVARQLEGAKIPCRWLAWTERLTALRDEEQLALVNRPEKQGYVEPNSFIRRLCRTLPHGSVYVADVGQNQLWSARNFSAVGKFLTTGGIGTMGYSVPAAIGAKLASPENVVLAVCGDGGFQMSMNELATICQHNVPIKIILLCNGRLGLVRELQHTCYGARESGIELSGSPDFGGIAHAYGLDHLRVDSQAEAEAAIERMLESSGAFVLECIVDPMESSK